MFCYIHIPFCNSKCKYCHFASFGNFDEILIDKYIDKLLLDINNCKIKSNKLKSIYFGGGTPGILKIGQLEKIIFLLKNKFGFENDIEITLETNPNNINIDNLLGWKKLGINRISIGIQTLNDNSLREIGRGNKLDIIESLNIIKKVGFNNISIDFIIGLPYVALGEIKKDIEYILDNFDFIKHISVYMLEQYYYSGKWNNISIKQDDYLEEYIKINDFLNFRGFHRYEISNFAIKGYECKHNKAYWNHSEVLAFGLGAHGFIDGKRSNYLDNFKDYYKNKINFEEKLNNDDIFLEKVMFGIRTTGLESDLYLKLNQEKLDYFINNGYLKIINNNLKLENKGVLVLDYILGELI